MEWYIAIPIILVILFLCGPLVKIKIEWKIPKNASKENKLEGFEQMKIWREKRGIKQTKPWYEVNKHTIISSRFEIGRKNRLKYRPRLE
ncbi:hypothetical protein ABFP05_18675 [Acinetobacter baumannii]